MTSQMLQKMRLLLQIVMRNYILQYKGIKAGIILLNCLNGGFYIVDRLVLQKDSKKCISSSV